MLGWGLDWTSKLKLTKCVITTLMKWSVSSTSSWVTNYMEMTVFKSSYSIYTAISPNPTRYCWGVLPSMSRFLLGLGWVLVRSPCSEDLASGPPAPPWDQNRFQCYHCTFHRFVCRLQTLWITQKIKCFIRQEKCWCFLKKNSLVVCKALRLSHKPLPI